MRQSAQAHLNLTNSIHMPWSASILIGGFRRRRREFPIIVSEPLVILRLHLRDRDRVGSGGRLRSVEASDEVLQIRGPGPVGGEGRGALGRRGRRRRLSRPFLLLAVVVVGAEQGERQRAPRLLPGRGGGGGSGGGRRGGARVVGSEPARHEVAPVVVEGSEGGDGRLRRGGRGRGGEGEVAEVEVLVEERRGRRREHDGVHCAAQGSRGGARVRALVDGLGLEREEGNNAEHRARARKQY